MGVKRYLETLGIDQLRFAVTTATEMLKHRTEEPRVRLWRLFDEDVCIAVFADKDYLRAVERLVEEAKVAARIGDDDRKQLQVKIWRVPESEAASWLEE